MSLAQARETAAAARALVLPGTHQFPPSDPLREILSALRFEDAEPTNLEFPAPRGGALSDMAMAQLLKRMNQPEITVHGFRSTFRDWAGQTTQFGHEEVEMALAHTITSARDERITRHPDSSLRTPKSASGP